jgi:hypothetical protein
MPIKPLPYIDKHGYQYSPEVQAKIDAAIHAKAIELSQNYQPTPEPMQSISYKVKEETVSEENPKFDPHWNITDYAKTLREILIFRINQLAIVNSANDFWQAQSDVTNLRNKLQDAYKSAIQKSQMQKAKQGQTVPAIWMFGAAAYDLITEQGVRLSDVLEMSGAKLAQMAAGQGAMLKAKAETDGESVYLFTKKSKEK